MHWLSWPVDGAKFLLFGEVNTQRLFKTNMDAMNMTLQNEIRHRLTQLKSNI